MPCVRNVTMFAVSYSSQSKYLLVGVNLRTADEAKL
jgi:hypothetical protein